MVSYRQVTSIMGDSIQDRNSKLNQFIQRIEGRYSKITFEHPDTLENFFVATIEHDHVEYPDFIPNDDEEDNEKEETKEKVETKEEEKEKVVEIIE